MKTASPVTSVIAAIGAAVITFASNWKVYGLLLLIAAAIVFPFTADGYFISNVTKVLIYAIAIAGLNLLTGFNGQFSLGHSAFYALGAYVAAILMVRAGMPYYLTIPFSAAACFVFGFLFGLPALRLEGIYLALATFALAIATPQIIKFEPIAAYTGGVQGLQFFDVNPELPFGIPVEPDGVRFYFTFAVMLVMFFLAFSLVNSRTGRAMKAIRDNPIAATVTGVNLSLFKSLTFGVSALFTGVAGALSAILDQSVAPDTYTIALSISLFLGMVVGGVGWIPGAFIGGAFLLYVPNISEHIAFSLHSVTAAIQSVIPFFPSIAEQSSKGLAGTVFGLFLILVIFVMPSGAAGLLRLAAQRFKR